MTQTLMQCSTMARLDQLHPVPCSFPLRLKKNNLSLRLLRMFVIPLVRLTFPTVTTLYPESKYINPVTMLKLLLQNDLVNQVAASTCRMEGYPTRHSTISRHATPRHNCSPKTITCLCGQWSSFQDLYYSSELTRKIDTSRGASTCF